MNRLIKIIFVFLSIISSHLFLFTHESYSQSITFQKVYGIGPREEIGFSVVQTSDNGYMVVGGGYNNMRTDQYGDTLWINRIPSTGRCIQKTFDNNFILTSVQYALLKFNINGDTLWTKNSYRPSDIEFVDETIDKGFILSGVLYGAEHYSYIIKTDSLGNLQWDNTYNRSQYEVKIVQTQDNGFVFTGTDTGVYVIKIDSVGNFLWYKNYKQLMSYATSIINVNNGFLICGNDKLLRIDREGNVIWSKTYSLGINRETYFFSLIQTIDHGYALTGIRDTTVETDFAPLVLLLKTDSSGNQLWYNLYGVENNLLDYNAGNDIRQTSDSGFIITGLIDTNVFEVKSFKKAVGFGGDLILIKTDKMGNIPTGIGNNIVYIPNNFELYQNYPNPFNPETVICYSLIGNGLVILKVYDILGKEVATLVNEKQNAGNYSVTFNGADLPSGIYFYQVVIHPGKIESGNFIQTRKMLLLK